MRTTDEIIAHKFIMNCPACDAGIMAQVVVKPNLQPVIFTADNAVEIQAAPTIERFTVGHSCTGRPEESSSS